jgi:hypothetical protein
MPGIANVVVKKGKIFRAADDNLAQPTQDLFNQLNAASSLSDNGIATQVIKETDREHVEKEAFGTDPDSWWSTIPQKQEIVKQGYLEAMKISLAQAEPLPIVTYWISGPQHFEMVIAKSKYQVTLFFVTPPHTSKGVPRDPASAVVEDLWVIAEKARIDEIKASFPPGYNLDQLDTAVGTTGLRRLQLKGY